MDLDIAALLEESLKGLASVPKGQRLELGVLNTPEFQRVKSLARRGHVPDDMVQLLTSFLRTENGQQVLRYVQALALAEMADQRGAFLPMGVGAGKTLVCFLAALVLQARRPILMVSGGALEATKRKALYYSKNWKIPNYLRVLSYQLISRQNGEALLERYNPDLIIFDECHRVKNRKAAVTKKFIRRFKAKPDMMCVAASGTISKRSLHDFAHIIWWCLKSGTPLPKEWHELEAWASALDERPNAMQRYRPGALLEFATHEEMDLDEYTTARRGFKRRLFETPGVVGTVEQGCDASLYIKGTVLEHEPHMEEHWDRLRNKWELPDRWPMADGMQVWAKARELALGFYYRCDPRPPSDWWNARKTWVSFVREVLKDNRRNLDSQKQVALACINHPEWYGDEEYKNWRLIRDTFKPNQVIEWLGESALAACISWLDKHGGIVWVEHTMFGHTLSQLTGIPYFGQGGRTGRGLYIEDHKGPAILSLEANKEERNLQFRPEWTKNLVASWPPNGLKCEQMLGRSHRPLQEADEVHFWTLIGCYENIGSFDQSRKDAIYLQDGVAGPQKLTIADIDMPEIFGKVGWAWNK